MSPKSERARRSSEQACAASRRVATLSREISVQIDELGSAGIPVRALSEDDSLPIHIDETIAVARTSTGEKKA